MLYHLLIKVKYIDLFLDKKMIRLLPMRNSFIGTNTNECCLGTRTLNFFCNNEKEIDNCNMKKKLIIK